MTELSFPAIAKAFGGRDHTTVMHAVEKISELINADDERTCADVGALIWHVEGSTGAHTLSAGKGAARLKPSIAVALPTVLAWSSPSSFLA
jgi:hypothetical protein